MHKLNFRAIFRIGHRNPANEQFTSFCGFYPGSTRYFAHPKWFASHFDHWIGKVQVVHWLNTHVENLFGQFSIPHSKKPFRWTQLFDKSLQFRESRFWRYFWPLILPWHLAIFAPINHDKEHGLMYFVATIRGLTIYSNDLTNRI